MTDDIIAILPESIAGVGIGSRIYRVESTELDTRTPTHYLKNMYDARGKTKKLVDKYINRRIQIARNFPYVIDTDHVFFSIKFRTSSYDDQTRAFVNVKYVDRIEDSSVVLVTGERIDSLNVKDTLISNRINAMVFYLELMAKSLADCNRNINYIREKFMD